MRFYGEALKHQHHCFSLCVRAFPVLLSCVSAFHIIKKKKEVFCVLLREHLGLCGELVDVGVVEARLDEHHARLLVDPESLL